MFLFSALPIEPCPSRGGREVWQTTRVSLPVVMDFQFPSRLTVIWGWFLLSATFLHKISSRFIHTCLHMCLYLPFFRAKTRLKHWSSAIMVSWIGRTKEHHRCPPTKSLTRRTTIFYHLRQDDQCLMKILLSPSIFWGKCNGSCRNLPCVNLFSAVSCVQSRVYFHKSIRVPGSMQAVFSFGTVAHCCARWIACWCSMDRITPLWVS